MNAKEISKHLSEYRQIMSGQDTDNKKSKEIKKISCRMDPVDRLK